MDNNSIKKLETDLWEAADLLRQGSKLTSQQYCMPVLGLLFLRYAYSRFKRVEAEILKNRPVRKGRVMPVEPQDFTEKSALYLPEMAQYSWLVNLPKDIKTANIIAENGQQIDTAGAAELMGCTRQNIQDLVRRGRMRPVITFRNNFLFLRSVL